MLSIIYLMATAALSGTPAPTSFELRDPASGAVLVQGIEQTTSQGDRTSQTTRYVDGQQQVLQEETYELDTASRRLARFASRSSTGEQASVEATSGNKLVVRYKSAAAQSADAATLGAEGRLVGKELPALMLDRWAQLISGDVARVDLIVPAHLETYRFRVRHDAARSKAGEKQVFIAEADSWFIRQFAPELSFTFADGPSGERRLLEMLGPSPVEIDGQKYRTVRLVLNYAH